MSESHTLQALERLRQLRERSVNDLTSRLADARQLRHRYCKNIEALSQLQNGIPALAREASQMANLARYRDTIQRVIAWQQQAQALAALEETSLHQALVSQARQEKCVALVLEQQLQARAKAREAAQQKFTDAQAMQAWLRRRSGGR